MPALTLFRNFTTRPFGGDDLHLVCLVLGTFRLVQLICLVPLCIHYYMMRVRAEDIWVNGVPPWCRQYDSSSLFLLYVEDIGHNHNHDITSLERSNFGLLFVVFAMVYFAADMCWIGMVWSASSLGTPTETKERDQYLPKLIVFKMFIGNVYPLLLLIFGIRKVYLLRENNYGCGDGNDPETRPDDDIWYGFLAALLVTYALELFVWPAVLANHIIRVLRSQSFLARSRSDADANERKAERLEHYAGMALKLLQCISCKKSDFRNKGELNEFARHFMDLMNYETKLDVVMSDIYIGLYLLARVQAEEKAKTIQRVSEGSHHLRRLIRDGQRRLESNSCRGSGDIDAVVDQKDRGDPFYDRRSSMMILCQNDSSTFDVHEREILGCNDADQRLMSDAARFANYAQIIYVTLKDLVEDEFTVDRDPDRFARELDSLFHPDFRLASIGCEQTILCYAHFVNSLVSTPYAILIDEEVNRIVITVRGTRSLDDMVADLQYNPASLEKTGTVCGFDGTGHFCHKGFLTRAKYLFNDIKKAGVLKTLYSDESPYKEYPLVTCGHSLGAGCATLLAIMLRPAFPSLKCFAYCPPGAVVDEKLAFLCDGFVTSFVRQDDLVPRISHHNFELLRDEFLNVISRIKVPKIKAFADIRKPCPVSAVAARNAKLLRATEDVPQGTPFYQQVKQFRSEREKEAIFTGSSRRNLFIAGRIVHLVDTGAEYVAYWADRREDFNQVILSQRIKLDHSMKDLVSVLRDIRLTGGVEEPISNTFHNSLNMSISKAGEADVEAEDGDLRLFMCCSNPDGKLPMVLLLISFIALVLSARSMTICRFFSRESIVTVNGESFLSLPFSVGLFSYTLLTCPDGSNCQDAKPSEFCAPYPDREGPHMMASRTLAFLAVLFGGLSFLSLSISTCLYLSRLAWRLIACMFLSTSLFQGLVFIMRQSDLCTTAEEVFDDTGLTIAVESKCYIDEGSIEAIIACSLYFLLSMGSFHIGRARR